MLGHVLLRGHRSYSNELVGELGVPQSWGLLGNRQLSYISFPSLEEAREGFEKFLGTNIAWPADDGTERRDEGPEGPAY